MIDIKNQKKIFEYDKNKFNFLSLFQSYLKTKNLENLHTTLNKNYLPLKEISVDNDQNQKIYNLLYKIDKGYDLNNSSIRKGNFLILFEKFVEYIAKNIFMENLVYQNRPTLRVSFPQNKAVGDWHRDREYNHPLEEINIWVPITIARESNSIWIESSFDKEDYQPININFGQFLIFDSALKHGNITNKEGISRISFDFRVIPRSLYKETNSKFKSHSQGINFKVGEYYSVTSI